MDARNIPALGLRRRDLLQYSVVTAGAIGLAACGTVTTAPTAQPEQEAEAEAPAKTEEAPAPAERVTVSHYVALNARHLELYPTLIEEPFENDHPNIDLETILREGPYYDKFNTLVAAGEPPDVLWLSQTEVFNQGHTIDVGPLIKRDNFDLSIYPQQLFRDGVMYEENVLGLPNQSGGNWPVMPYNKEILANAGVSDPPVEWGDPSWNAETFLEALVKTTQREGENPVHFGIGNIGRGVIAANWGPFWGARWVAEDFKTVVCDSPEMIDAIRYLTDLSSKHRVMPVPGELNDTFGTGSTRNNFLNGKLAFLQTSGGGTFAIARGVQEGKPFAYAPLPTFMHTASAQALDSNGLIGASKVQDEGWELIKWHATHPNWAIGRGNAPARLDHFEVWARELYGGDVAEKIRVEAYANSLANASRYDGLRVLPNWRNPIFDKIITPALDALYRGQGDVVETMNALRQQIQAEIPE